MIFLICGSLYLCDHHTSDRAAIGVRCGVLVLYCVSIPENCGSDWLDRGPGIETYDASYPPW